MENSRGALVLKAVPDGKLEEVGAFLAKVFKGVSREKMAGAIKKAPVVLGKNVPSKIARTIAQNLEKLGATVDFLPSGEIMENSTAQVAGIASQEVFFLEIMICP